MKYETLSKRALGCMYTAEVIGDLVILLILLAVNRFLFLPKEIAIGQTISWVIVGLVCISLPVKPYFRYRRYRYRITEECIDLKEGYLFQERNIVPIERLHKLETAKGPIDQLFHVAKVTVTTAGGDVTLRFLDEEKAEQIAEHLRTRINAIVKEQRDADGTE